MTVGAALKSNWSRLLATHGYDLVLRREVQGAYDASTGTVATTNTDQYVRGFFKNSRRDRIDDRLTERGNRTLYLDNKQTTGNALTLPPKTGDLVIEDAEDDGVVLTVVQKIRSGDTIIGYICEVSE